LAGANIVAQKLDLSREVSATNTVTLDEIKIRGFLDQKKIGDNPESGVIENYAF